MVAINGLKHVKDAVSAQIDNDLLRF